MKLKQLLLIGSCLFLYWPYQAVSLTLGVDHEAKEINPIADLVFFSDPSLKLTLQEILALPPKSFKPPHHVTGSSINFGFSQDAYWIRLDLERAPDAPSEWIIEIPYQGLDEIDFYAPNKPPVITGASRSIESRSLYHRYFVFPVELTTTSQSFYFRIRSFYSVTIPIHVIERQSFIQKTQKNLITQFLYFGGILALILYNFQLYISLRDKTYLFYSLFGLSMSLGIFSGNGFGRILFWPDAPAWDQIAQSTLISLGGCFSVLFARSFLKTNRYLGKLDQLLSLLAIAYIAIPIGLLSTLFFHELQGFWFQVLMLLTAPYFVLITIASVITIRSGHESAKYFLLAWIFLCIGVVIATLRTFDWLPTNLLTSYAIQIGTGVEMLLLSYALAYRIRIERAKRDAAQQEALNAKHLLVESLQASESHLEQLVEERTSQLQATLANEKYLRDQYVRFTALISHEFRNPLNNIQSQTDLIQREHNAGIDNLNKRTTVISAAITQLSSLFDRWVKTDRIKSTLALENITKISVNHWVNGLVERNGSSQVSHKFHFVPSPLEVSLQVDDTLLEVALINLLDNACKYSPDNSVVQVKVLTNHHETGIEVTDQGEGIDPKNYQSIFEESFRVFPHHPKYGSGLGLAFVQRIANLHGGRITVDSNLGTGTTFTFWLPTQARC